jgi:hypothetical protein
MMLGTMAAAQLGGCVTVKVGADKPPAPEYDFAPPPAPWESLPDTDAAHAYRSRQSHAVLGLASTCDGSVETDFTPLLNTLTSAVPRREVVEPNVPVPNAKLPARATLVKGQEGGTPVEMLAIVLKSRRCVYDVMVTAPRLEDADHRAALALAASLSERAAR